MLVVATNIKEHQFDTVTKRAQIGAETNKKN